MKKSTLLLPEMKLVVLKGRTTNAIEMNPDTAKMGETIQTYFQQGLHEKTSQRKNQSVIYIGYTDYESDFTGEYTFFIGQEVTDFTNIPDKLSPITVPAQTFVKFTNDPGPMPDVCFQMWQKIWAMNDKELGGKRSYKVDLQVHDERSMDPSSTVLDILIGIDENS